jgi:hypothetical protein
LLLAASALGSTTSAVRDVTTDRNQKPPNAG